MAGLFLFRRHKSQTARASQQVYPELAYLYDPPVPGSENGSRGALPSGASPRTPGGGGGGGGGSGEPVGPFGVGGPGSDGDDGATGAAGGATALGATLRGGGGSRSNSDQRSSSPEGRSAGSRSSSVGSVVSFLGPAGRPPVMGEGMAALNGSSSGSSNAALLAASARRDREAGDGSPLAPVPSRSDDENAANGEEARPFLTAAGAVAAGGSSEASSRDRSAERGAATHQRDETALWNGEEMDRELGERLHEQQVEEARQRRERARAFLLQAKERQEQRIPMPSHAPANGESSAGMAAAAAAVGGAAALASRGQQRNPTNPKLQHMQSREQQWWQQSSPSSPTATSPTRSSAGAAFFPPPAATHANQGYYPIYPPISPTYPRSGPILTSQHIEANRLEQVQHARATAAAASSPPTTSAYPTFHRPGPNYPAPSNWQQSANGSYTYTNNGATAAAAAASVRGRPFFHQNTSYVPPHRATIDNYSSLSNNNNNAFGPIVNAPRRGSAGSIQSGSVYSTILEEENQHPPQRPQQQQHQRKQSLQSIMRQMNSLDEEDSEGDEGQGFLQAPRRVLSVRNGAVTPSTDGEEDERDGGARRGGAKKEVRWARDDGVERNLI